MLIKKANKDNMYQLHFLKGEILAKLRDHKVCSRSQYLVETGPGLESRSSDTKEMDMGTVEKPCL